MDVYVVYMKKDKEARRYDLDTIRCGVQIERKHEEMGLGNGRNSSSDDGSFSPTHFVGSRNFVDAKEWTGSGMVLHGMVHGV